MLLESPSLLPYLNTRAHNTLHLLWSLSDSFPAISEALTCVPVLGGGALSQGPCQRLRLSSPWTDGCQILGLLSSSPLIGLLYSMDSSVGLHFPFISDLLVLIACLNMCLSLLYISFQWTDVARISASVLPCMSLQQCHVTDSQQLTWTRPEIFGSPYSDISVHQENTPLSGNVNRQGDRRDIFIIGNVKLRRKAE